MSININIPSLPIEDFIDTTFDRLMLSRIERVLLVCSKYDTYILEEDGRIEDQLFHEYTALKLRNPPQFIYARSSFAALETLRSIRIDLVILMDSASGMPSTELAQRIKKEYPFVPVVSLSPFQRGELHSDILSMSNSAFDYRFQWLGQANILMAIVKLVEDKLNAEQDIHEIGAQAILLVEDNIHFISVYLPVIYQMIFKQSLRFMSEGMNEHQQMLRLRGRPKVLLANTLEEALIAYERYKHNLLGIISDIEFENKGKLDPKAGFLLLDKIREENPTLPFIIQSSEKKNFKEAKRRNIGYVDKNVEDLGRVIEKYCFDFLSFGDLIFRDPNTGEEIDRVTNLADMEEKVFTLPDESLSYHLGRNDLFRWLKANALFRLATNFQFVKLSDLPSLDAARSYIRDTISSFRKFELRGKVARFDRRTFSEYFLFSRIGDGSLGGKARGLAYLDIMLKEQGSSPFSPLNVRIPRTIVLTTDVFDRFMDDHDLHRISHSNTSDAEILKAFVNAEFDESLMEDLKSFLRVINGPLAVRSSSLLEDSLHQPFAGIYSTYMIPYSSDSVQALSNLMWAIKAVFASTYFEAARSYMAATSIKLGDEKMAVILQEVVGSYHGSYYYPSLSGVARSLNYYPVGMEKAEQGVALVAIGLGKYVVGGGISLRFSPAYPKTILQLSSPQKALSDTQKYFYALKTDLLEMHSCTDETSNIELLPIKMAHEQLLHETSSTYDFQSQRLTDSSIAEGTKVITFSKILNLETYPLARIIQYYLKTCQDALNHPVELEYAMELGTKGKSIPQFYLLQVRPMLLEKEMAQLTELPSTDKLLALSRTVLGNGQLKGIRDIVYTIPENFDPLKSRDMAHSIAKINDGLRNEGIRYILIAPGRWGSSDPNLGIPVQWPQISNACLLIETHLEKYRIEPSQGTHFFHNLTTMNVGYFSITPYHDDSFMNFESLSRLETLYEDKYIRHVRTSQPVRAIMNAKNGLGFIELIEE